MCAGSVQEGPRALHVGRCSHGLERLVLLPLSLGEQRLEPPARAPQPGAAPWMCRRWGWRLSRSSRLPRSGPVRHCFWCVPLRQPQLKRRLAGPSIKSTKVEQVLKPGDIVTVLESCLDNGHQRVRIGPDQWISRVTGNGKTLAKACDAAVAEETARAQVRLDAVSPTFSGKSNAELKTVLRQRELDDSGGTRAVLMNRLAEALEAEMDDALTQIIGPSGEVDADTMFSLALEDHKAKGTKVTLGQVVDAIRQLKDFWFACSGAFGSLSLPSVFSTSLLATVVVLPVGLFKFGVQAPQLALGDAYLLAAIPKLIVAFAVIAGLQACFNHDGFQFINLKRLCSFGCPCAKKGQSVKQASVIYNHELRIGVDAGTWTPWNEREKPRCCCCGRITRSRWLQAMDLLYVPCIIAAWTVVLVFFGLHLPADSSSANASAAPEYAPSNFRHCKQWYEHESADDNWRYRHHPDACVHPWGITPTPVVVIAILAGGSSIAYFIRIHYGIVAIHAPRAIFAANDHDHPYVDEPEHALHKQPVSFDEHGHATLFDDTMYDAEAAQMESNPYSYIFSGFKQSAKFYKVEAMIVMFLVQTFGMFSTLVPQQSGGAMICAVCITLCGAFSTIRAFTNTPHTHRLDARLAQIQSVAILCVAASSSLCFGGEDSRMSCALFGSVADQGAEPSVLMTLVGLVLMLLVSAGVICNVVFLAMKTQAWKARSWSNLTLTEQSTGKELPNLAISQWDVRKETSSRLWFPFWRAVFSSDKALRNAQKEFLRQSAIAQHCSADSFEAHHNATQEQVAAMRHLLVDVLGPDAYFDDVWQDGRSVLKDQQLDNTDHFGTLNINPYPFQASMSWAHEGSDDVADLQIWRHADKIVEFSLLNKREDVQQRRDIRRILRSLSRAGQLSFQHQEKCSFSYEVEVRKTRTVRDHDGNSHTEHYTEKETRYEYLLCQFMSGVVSGADQRCLISMSFQDGYTLERGFHTGDHRNVRNTLSAKELGVTSDFALTMELARLLSQNENLSLWEKPLRDLMEGVGNDSSSVSSLAQKQDVDLPVDFWAGVYQHAQPLERLSEYMQRNKGSVLVQYLEKNAGLLQFIESLRATVQSDAKHELWFVFFHDVILSNQEYQALQDRANYNPFDSTSMCHNPLPRDELENHLKLNGGVRLSSGLLDELYTAMDSAMTNNPIAASDVEENVAPTNKATNEPKWMNSQQRQAFVDLLDTTDRSLEQAQVADRILADMVARLDAMELPELPPPGPYSGG